jgi:ornithine carbamoyltransferase
METLRDFIVSIDKSKVDSLHYKEVGDLVKVFLTPYKITMELLQKTENPDVLFLHCLPAFHDFETELAKTQYELGYDIREVTDEVFRSRHSVVFEEAENRLHTIKAVMVATV